VAVVGFSCSEDVKVIDRSFSYGAFLSIRAGDEVSLGPATRTYPPW